jgi:hypothetical protein
MLSDPDTLALPCLKALQGFYGNEWLLWEPETLWIDLRKRGLDIPVSNREQIMAGRSLITTARFWYDAIVFDKTCIAFNNEEATHVGVEDAPTAYVAWAVTEAQLIHTAFEDASVVEFDREPIGYMAVQMYREGFLLPPKELAVAESVLARMYPKTKEIDTLRSDIRDAWAHAPDITKLRNTAFPETPEGVQLARLASVKLYCHNRQVMLDKQLAALADATT